MLENEVVFVIVCFSGTVEFMCCFLPGSTRPLSLSKHDVDITNQKEQVNQQVNQRKVKGRRGLYTVSSEW